MWNQPRKWNEQAKKLGVRLKVFCASIADIFEKWPGKLIDVNGAIVCRRVEGRTERKHWLAFPVNNIPKGWKAVSLQDVRIEFFKLVDETPWLDWLILTKRPELIGDMWPNKVVSIGGIAGVQTHRENVWLGCSVSDQETANQYLPVLKNMAGYARYIWISAEPLTGHITQCGNENWKWSDFDWCVIGGESGLLAPNGTPLAIINQPAAKYARRCHSDWIEEILDECSSEDPECHVPCFVKQTGNLFLELLDQNEAGDRRFARIVELSGGKYTMEVTGGLNVCEWNPPGKGEDIDIFPDMLKVQEFPVA
jgi:protein gp37